MLLTICTLLFVASDAASQRPSTVTVPNLGFYLPSSASIRETFGATWTTIGLRNRPDWTRRDVVYSPDIRVMSAPAQSGGGTSLALVPAFWRASLQLGGSERPLKTSMFAEAGVLGAFSSSAKSRFVAAPATGIGLSVSRDRLDVEAQYLQPLRLDGRDFTGFAISIGYRL